MDVQVFSSQSYDLINKVFFKNLLQYQQMQNDLMTPQGAVNMVPNAFMQNVAPPLPIDYQPPPPPPPQQQTQESIQNIVLAQSTIQAPNTLPDQPTKEFQSNAGQKHTNVPLSTNQTEPANNTHTHGKNTNFEQNYSQQNQDGFHRNNRNSRWNNNNRNTRLFGGNQFSNRNTYDRNEPECNDDPDSCEYANEEKSQEELAFDIQFGKWEDSFMEWKRNNANHPDQGQYNDFVIKMEGCRKQLLQRRKMLRQKRLDSISSTQKTHNQTMKSEIRNDLLDENQEDEKVIPTGTSSGFGQESSNFLTVDRSRIESGIPGLDLVSGGSVPKTDPNIVAHVNNILGNPEIKSLLSNLQKQQNDTDTVNFQPNNDNSNENDSNNFERFDNENRFENLQNNDIPQQNPFRNQNRDDSEFSRYQSKQFEEKIQRGQSFNENRLSGFSSFDRDTGDFSQQVNII